MKFHHHKASWFPFILIGLTLGLLSFMVFAFSERNPETTSSMSEMEIQEPVVTDEDYRINIQNVISSYLQQRDSATTDLDRLVLAEDTLDKVLAIRVSAAYKELHLNLATSLFQMVQGLKGEEGAYEKGRERFDQIVEENPWLK